MVNLSLTSINPVDGRYPINDYTPSKWVAVVTLSAEGRGNVLRTFGIVLSSDVTVAKLAELGALGEEIWVLPVSFNMAERLGGTPMYEKAHDYGDMNSVK